MASPGYTPSVQIEGVEFTLSHKLNFEELNDLVSKKFEQSLRDIAVEVKEYWQTEAGKQLNTSKEAYLKSITLVNNGDGTYAVTVGGKGGRASKSERWLARARENGTPSFDMKPGILRGAASRPIRMPDGTFRTVASSKPDKFIHPGVPAAHIKDKVIARLKKKIIPKYLKQAIAEATAEWKEKMKGSSP